MTGHSGREKWIVIISPMVIMASQKSCYFVDLPAGFAIPVLSVANFAALANTDCPQKEILAQLLKLLWLNSVGGWCPVCTSGPASTLSLLLLSEQRHQQRSGGWRDHFGQN